MDEQYIPDDFVNPFTIGDRVEVVSTQATERWYTHEGVSHNLRLPATGHVGHIDPELYSEQHPLVSLDNWEYLLHVDDLRAAPAATTPMLTITMSLANDAFAGDDESRADEIHYALEKLYPDLANGKTTGVVMDSNGNSVGQWSIEDK